MKDLLKEALLKILQIDMIRFLTAFTVLGILLLLTNALIYLTIPAANEKMIINLLGIIEGSVMTIVGYEFGSSKDKKKPGENL